MTGPIFVHFILIVQRMHNKVILEQRNTMQKQCSASPPHPEASYDDNRGVKLPLITKLPPKKNCTPATSYMVHSPFVNDF
jgi:hypothetical protein